MTESEQSSFAANGKQTNSKNGAQYLTQDLSSFGLKRIAQELTQDLVLDLRRAKSITDPRLAISLNQYRLRLDV